MASNQSTAIPSSESQLPPRIPFTPEELSAITKNPTNRLRLSPNSRIPIATTFAALSGAVLGFSHGAQTTGLRFRAENSHRLPTNEKAWYLYHKSKNYAVMLGGLKEASYMGTKLGFWTGLFFVIEEAMDGWKGRRDAASSVVAGLTVAGAFSLWNMLPLTSASRITRLGLLGGLAYGVAQDAVTLLQGRQVSYVEWALGRPGFQ